MVDFTHLRFDGRPAARAPRRSRSPRGAGHGPIAAPSRHEPTPASSGVPAWVLQRAGLDPASYRHAPLGRRLTALQRALRADTDAAMQARLLAHPDLLPLALSTLLIGVTGFFRDTMVFGVLRDVVVPALVRRPGPIRVWSLGCSTGAELASVALLLADAGVSDRATLLGTDCRADVIDEARAGWFPESALAGVETQTRDRYFERERQGWRLAAPVRRRMAWHVLDGTRDVAAGPWDLVLCRNVAIYLQADVCSTMLRRVDRELTPGGYLVLGKAERPPAGLAPGARGQCVYQRRE
jgi:chemotaxis protein methyltransferase CheR